MSAAPSPCPTAVDLRAIAAREIRPGDYLPPQAALHGTKYQQEGFTVGSDRCDVLTGIAALPGRVLLFGPGGTLDSVVTEAQVTVRRQH